jgi:putative redox protein
MSIVDAVLDYHSTETRDSDGNRHRRSTIDTHLTFYGDLDAEQVQRLAEIAGRCPVHRALKGDIEILTSARHTSTEQAGEGRPG